jgi:ATP-dependent helicase YprA (DUF1998 family)
MEYFSSLIDQLAKRASRATLGQFGIRSKPLREYLWQKYSSAPGCSGSFLGDPVFEATFGWKPYSKTMRELSGELLEDKVVYAMANPPKELADDYEFKSDWQPYAHQFEAWTHLTADDTRSVIVSSGTGSGKTECFLVPIFNDIVKRKSKSDGVEALFLYPLNALINSQKERLTAWSKELGSDVKFCLYNGDTKESVSSIKQNELPNQILSRKLMRKSPAQILVTNATMLEYMLVRKQDQPILSQSQGKLRWIVLDEAHTYIGSQAAELSLLLRRVMHGFGVEPCNVRFVATSATIGGKDSDKELKHFLADIAGVDVTQVFLVKGEREINHLMEASALNPLDIEQAEKIASQNNCYEYLSNILPLRSLREHLVQKDNRLTLTQIRRLLSVSSSELISEDLALRWLDICASVKNDKGDAFIPFRLHLFHRVSDGLWACSNNLCKTKLGSPLEAIDWQFGMVYMSRRKSCSCGAPVFEMVSCTGCGTSLLLANAELNVSHGDTHLKLTRPDSSIDEFALDIENESYDSAGENENEEDEEDDTYDSVAMLSQNSYDETGSYWLDNSGLMKTESFDNAFPIKKVEGYSRGAKLALRCPCCQNVKRDNFDFYRHYRNGAPFMLSTVLPTLLEYCEKGKGEQSKGPWQGRRMITFTDSRQGTARFSARTQQDAERHFLRSTLFHLLLDRTLKSGVLSAEDKEKLTKYQRRRLMSLEVGDDEMVDMMDESISKLVGSSQTTITWAEAETFISQDENLYRWIKESYKHFDEQMSMVKEPLLLARLLLLREFNSRPKRQNTLETLGLVCIKYDDLNNKGNTAPTEWLALFGTKDEGESEWIKYLTLCINFFVRSVKAVNISQEELRWIGAKFPPSVLVEPNADKSTDTKVQRWPQVNAIGNQNRMVRLLVEAFDFDLSEKEDKAKINIILKKAWQVIQRNLLVANGAGYSLDLSSKVSFSLIAEKRQCPHTQKIVDCHLKGLTPYLNNYDRHEDQLCKIIDIPTYPYPFGRSVEEGENISIEASRQWQETNELLSARKENAWSDLADRIVERTPYYRVAEHSAQIGSPLLRDYEAQFKAGKINVLSCSTTMEMGVDIGGISVVAMNNAPPNPANYLQRSGRAGRRGESKSVSLTLCKNTPHGEHIFANTRWAFDTKIHVPNVSISSEYIVKRHVNALLLSVFLKMDTEGDSALKLSCGNFFLSLHEHCPSQAENFVEWCKTDALKIVDHGLKTLLFKTALFGTDNQIVVNESAKQMQGILTEWLNERDILKSQGENLANDPNRLSIASAAVEMQIQRLDGEYLLSELARSAYLPGYGFPTDIVSLNNDNIESINKRKNLIQKIKDAKQAGNTSLEHRIDNLYSSRDYPSRDLSVAIRDYAPGSEVVIDGRVYQSGGVVLNWHSPANVENVSEIQSLKWAWRCKHCGASGTSHTQPKQCSTCSSGEEKIVNHRYLQPSSFAIDIRNRPHNDISKLKHIPFIDPWVTVENEQWRELSVNPSAITRSSHDGHVYYYSDGGNSKGYALCLECGRMDSMTGADGETPFTVLKNHTRLRGGKGDLATDSETYCGGNEREFSIKGPISLGHSTNTDVFELVLFNEDGSCVNDKVIARSIAVLLRNTLAEKLGINSAEIGCTSKPVNYNEQPAQAIVLYDSAAGGAGFVIQASDFIENLLGKAKKVVARCDCDKACHKCLVDFSTQHSLDLLDRHAVVEFLDVGFFNRLKLPEDKRVFGDSTRLELKSVRQAMNDYCQKHQCLSLRLYLDANYLGQLENWPLLNDLYDWVRNFTIELVIDSNSIDKLTIEPKVALSWFENHSKIKLKQRVFDIENVKYLAETLTDKGSQVWGESTETASHLFTGFTPTTDLADVEIDLSTAVETQSNIQIKDELNGNVSDFGQLFWTKLFKDCNWLMDKLKTNKLVTVGYCDRYLASPLPVSISLSVISALLEFFPEAKATVVTETLRPRNEDISRVSENWNANEDRKHVFEEYIDQTGYNLEFFSTEKKNLPHARIMTLTFEGKTKVKLFLDQGFGYWNINYHNPGNEYPFQDNLKNQVEAIKEGRWLIRNGRWPTVLFVIEEKV